VFADFEQSNAFRQREDWHARDHVLMVPRLLWIHSDGPNRGLAVRSSQMLSRNWRRVVVYISSLGHSHLTGNAEKLGSSSRLPL
jgi:hypothetical protein